MGPTALPHSGSCTGQRCWNEEKLGHPYSALDQEEVGKKPLPHLDFIERMKRRIHTAREYICNIYLYD